MTSRTTGGTTATLSYDLLDHLTKWYVSATNQEQYIYDASGNRILRRSTTSSGTTMTVYAFGLEDHTYSGSGTNQGNTYYYSLAGRLIGSNDANGTVFYMTDTLGSILASFTNTAGGAALKGNQVFGPYGNARYSAGTINTAKGFTGQYNDALTGLDYYNARYYDPVAGVFLSADVKQGDMQGVNPYAYVNGNPETDTDPTGYYMGTSIPFSQQGGAIGYIAPGSDILYSEVNNGNYFGSITGVSGQNTPTSSNIDVHTQTLQAAADPYNPLTDANNSPLAKLSQAIGLPALQQVWGDPNATWQDKFGAFFHFLGTNANNVFQFAMIFGGGPEGDAEEVVAEEASTLARDLAPREQYVLDNLDSLIPDHGGEGDNILFGDKVPSYNGSRPDIVTPKAIVEVTGEGPNGLPADLAPGLRKANQLTNFVKGANPGQSVYLAYDGDVSQFSEALNNFLEKWGIIVVPFNLP